VSNHADLFRLLTTYGWHNPDFDCWPIDLPPTDDAGWRSLPDTCECGFYDALKHAMKEDHVEQASEEGFFEPLSPRELGGI
jgi:hypothetical protein